MTNTVPERPDNSHARSWLLYRSGLVTCGFLAAIGFLMATGHTAHLLGILPYLVLAACPLMHIFMHSGHKHGNHGVDERKHEDQRGCH